MRIQPPTLSLPGLWGDAGRNSIRGPRQFSLDASVARVFRLKGRLNFEGRAGCDQRARIASRLPRSTRSTRVPSSVCRRWPIPCAAADDLPAAILTDGSTYSGSAAFALGVHRALVDGTREPRGPAGTAADVRASTHLVVQTVSVKDKSGKPIAGLTARDFVVTENGQPQQIAFVEYQPLDSAPAPSSTPVTTVEPVTAAGVSVPMPGDVRYRGRRLLVLYFDLFNMSFFDQLRVLSSADEFMSARLQPPDMVAVMVFQDGRVRLKQDFSDDRAALREIVRDLMTDADEGNSGGRVVWDGGGAFGEDDDTFNLFTTDRQLAALQTAVTGLAPLPEVKTLIYSGSGLRLNGADNQAQLRATVNAAVRSNVTINPIDTRGLVAAPPLGDATRPSPGGIGMFSGALAQAATTRQLQSQDTYYALAKDTGGRAMFDSNDLSLGMAQAAQAVTGYYMIGYYTNNTATDGRFRRVRIALESGVSAELSYRPGYYGAKDFSRFNAVDKERQLEEALRLEDPITDIPMAMEVNYFQLNRAEYFVPVSVRMPGSELTRPRRRRGGARDRGRHRRDQGRIRRDDPEVRRTSSSSR